MQVPSRFYYLNGDFDLTLGGANDIRQRYLVAEMTAWFVPLSWPQDRVLLDVSLPEDYYNYLQSRSISPARPTPQDSRSPVRAAPWGWNHSSLQRLADNGAECIHPDLISVRTCNSRLFSYTLAHHHNLGVPDGKVCRSTPEVLEALRRLYHNHSRLVVKPEFGNTGIGFSIIDLSSHDEIAIPQAVQNRIDSGDTPLFIEPWRERIIDLSTRIELHPDGTIGRMNHYQTLASSAGAFYGLIMDQDNASIRPWIPALQRTAHIVAGALHTEGYFGPASFDSMVVAGHHTGPELIPLIEINARQSMSAVALSICDRLTLNTPVLLRTISSRRFKVPATYADLQRILGKDLWNKMIWLTPLSVRDPHGTARIPFRSMFLMWSTTPDDLQHQHREMIERIKR